MTIHTIAAQTHGRYLIDSPTDAAVGDAGAAFTATRRTPTFTSMRCAHRRRTGSWRLVSVQALNRFYSKGGDVVANWMTKQDREQAIADNVAYVAAVLSEMAERVRRGPPAGLRRASRKAWRWRIARRRWRAVRATG